MAKAKVAITISQNILNRIDHLVAEQTFPNRSSAIALSSKRKNRTAG